MLDTIEKEQLNGLDPALFAETMATITADPKMAVCGFEVRTRWAGATRSETRVDQLVLGGERIARDFEIVADEPEEFGGQNTAPNPQELLMAAVNACMTVGYIEAATMMGIEIESLDITMRGDLDLHGFLGLRDDVPPGYRALDYDVKIKGSGTPEQFEEIHRQVMRLSPNFYNLSQPVKMNGNLLVG